MIYHKIGFIGLGLIGGSIAKTIKKIYPDMQIIAYDSNSDQLNLAYEQHIISSGTNDINNEFSDCDVIFLCTPVITNNKYLELLKNVIHSNTLITDVGSVKSIIHEKITELNLDASFIGGHPMAGSEKSGFHAASDHLIENAYYVLTPTSTVAPEKVLAFQNFIASLGAIPFILDAREHDHIVASISHLPHIIASTLVNFVKDSDSDDEKMKTVAAGGFKDITRIASSSPEMWQHICLMNSDAIESALDSYIQYLQQMKSYIHDASSVPLFDTFQSAKDYRDSITINHSGVLPKIHALYCDIIDEAGGIATIATILATNRISIKNIGIIHNRTFEQGVLRIEFYDEEAYKNSILLLQKYRYTVYES